MAGWCDTCFCFRDVQRAVTVIGMLSLGCPIIEILIEVAVFSGVKGMDSSFKVEGDSKEAITYQLYIALAAMDFVLAIFAIILLYGNERTDLVRARKYLIPWAVLIPFYILYETAINIYYFYNQFNNKYEGPLKDGHHLGFVIVPLVYWIIKDILLFFSFVFVIMRIQSLTPVTQYVEQDYPPVQGCGCSQGPPISLPAPVSFTGGCSTGACSRSAPQPVSGYYNNGHSTPVGKTGWSTSVYNNGRL